MEAGHVSCSSMPTEKSLVRAGAQSQGARFASLSETTRRGPISSTLIIQADTRLPVPTATTPEAFWTHSALGAALYANMHHYDFVYAVLPEEGCRRQGVAIARLPTWCRLLIVSAAFGAGYTWAMLMDSDTMVHQPYSGLHVLRRMRAVGGYRWGGGYFGHLGGGASQDPNVALIAQSNSWWQPKSKGGHGVAGPCGGNLLFHAAASAWALLAAWWGFDGESTYGNCAATQKWCKGIVGKREQQALWDLLAQNRSINEHVATVNAKTFWCSERSAGRYGCGEKREPGRAMLGCSSDYFFCHAPHYPNNLSTRVYAMRSERVGVEGAAAMLGCPAGGAPCSPGSAAVLHVTAEELTALSTHLQSAAWWGAEPVRWREGDVPAADHGESF